MGARVKCQKIAYKDRIAAQMALIEIQRKGKHDRNAKQELAVYRCPYCFSWHLTSQRQNRRKGARNNNR